MVDGIATVKNFRGIRQCDWHQNLPTENGSQRCWCMKSNRVLWSWPTVSESDTPRGVRFGGRDSIGGRRIPTLVMDCRRTNAGQPSQQTTGQAFETADRLAKNLHHHESLAVRNQPPSPRQLQLQSRYTIELRWRLERLGPWYRLAVYGLDVHAVSGHGIVLAEFLHLTVNSFEQLFVGWVGKRFDDPAADFFHLVGAHAACGQGRCA